MTESGTLPGIAPPREQRKRKTGKKLEDSFAERARHVGLPEPARELTFAKKYNGRGWRFDFAFFDPTGRLPYRVAVEIEGLVVRRIGGQLVTQGRHANVQGFREDCIKYATAALLGWTVLRFEKGMISSGDAIEFTRKVLISQGWTPPY